LILESLVPERPAMYISLQGVREWIKMVNWPAPSFVLNLVADTEGNFTGENGSSRDLSNDVDKQVLLGLREAADGIFTTSKTAKQEQYRRSALAPLALISRTADFEGIPAVIDGGAGPSASKVFLLVPSKLVRQTRKRFAEPWIEVVGIGKGSLFRITLALTRLNWRRVVVESGPEFSTWLVQEFGIKYLNLTVVSQNPAIDASYARNALNKLGVSGGTLESAHRIDTTLITRWSDLYSPKGSQRRGNRFGQRGRIA
jgi:riboflavin biosynthesis pyrimidine reductase